MRRAYGWMKLFILGIILIYGTLSCASPAQLVTEAPVSSPQALVEKEVIVTTVPSDMADVTPTSVILAATPTTIAEPTIEVGLPPPMIQEARYLTLEWPPKVRVGDGDTVRLTLEMDTQGNLTPTAEVEGHQVSGEVVFVPDLYDTHSVLAEASLALAGIEVSPDMPYSQSLLPGGSVSFYWSIRPPEVGSYAGTVWLKLRFLPLAGGAPSERTIAAQRIEIEAVNLLGMGGKPARILGVVGAVLGSLLGLEDLLSLGGKFMRNRLKQNKKV